MQTLTTMTTVTALTATLAAQQTFQVPDGSPIQPVVDAASPGDVIELAPGGTYDKFDLTKGLTIVGPATLGTVLQAADLNVAVPPGQNARLIDLAVSPQAQPFFGSIGTTVVTSGVVVFEGCAFLASGEVGSAVSVTDAHAVFDHCVVDGSTQSFAFSTALTITNANVTAVDTRFLGANGDFTQTPGRGIVATGTGTLHLSSCVVEGGDEGGIVAEAPSQPAITTDVPTWLTDCIVTGGDAFGRPAAIGIVATAPTQVARSTIQGGAGPLPGAPFTGPVTTNPVLLGARSTQPTVVGGSWSITFTANQPGVGITLLGTTAPLVAPIASPILGQPLWLAPVFVASSLTTAANSEATLTLNVPNDPTLRNRAFDFVGVRLAGASALLSPVVPVTIR